MAGNSDRPPAPPAGWFADPAGSPYLRWWDGSGWTDNFIDARTGAPPAELAPGPAPRGAIAAAVVEPREAMPAETSANTMAALSDEPFSPHAASSSDTASSSETGLLSDGEAPRPAIAMPPAAAIPAAVPATPEPTPSAGPTGAGLSSAPTEAQPLTRREARARERLAEEARTGALAIPVHAEETQSEPAQSEPAQSEPAQSEPAQSEPAQSEPAQPEQLQSLDAEELLAQPVSAARSVDSLGEVSEPDAVAPPEEGISPEGVPVVGSLGIPGPETLVAPASDVSSAEARPANVVQEVPAIPLPGTTVPAPSLTDCVSGPTASAVPVTPVPSAASSPSAPSSDALFDFAGITPTGAVPIVTPVVAPPANAWAASPAPNSTGAFPLALGDGPSYTPMETRRPASAGSLPDPGVSTLAVWVFAALPLLHGLVAWLVFDQLKPADATILRWVVLFGPIILYLVLAGIDRWVLLRAGHLSVAPVAYAIVPPLYLAIRVVRMGVGALAPLVVWVAVTAVVAGALIFLLPNVLTALTG